jgi:hypothetical protein
MARTRIPRRVLELKFKRLCDDFEKVESRNHWQDTNKKNIA